MNREEQEIQITFFEWCKWNEKKYQGLKLIHHIPNGGKRTKAEAAIFKAMGVRSGIPDVFLPEARGIYHGLYIEFKSGTGKPSANQIELLDSLQRAGYFACVCNNVAKAIGITQRYLSLPKVNLMHLLIDKCGENLSESCILEGGEAK